MTFPFTLWRKASPSAAGRDLARVGHRAQREFVKATARQMLTDMGLPRDPRLEPRIH